MRRQVKPFVTERRSNNRRRDPSPSGEFAVEASTPKSRSFVEADRKSHTDAADDSYEAALRAADALFSPSPLASGAPGTQTRAIPQGPAHCRSPSSFETTPSEFAAATFKEMSSPVSPSSERDAPFRRILQAIEPPAEDRFAALEAERAPKRRGRKPGSKNKPKAVVGDDWPASAPRPAAATVEALQGNQPLGVSLLALSPAVSSSDYGDALTTITRQPRGRNDKFGWKRNGLRPGERWKRRLPKAAR